MQPTAEGNRQHSKTTGGSATTRLRSYRYAAWRTGGELRSSPAQLPSAGSERPQGAQYTAPHRHPAHSTAFAHSTPFRRGSPLAQSTLRLLCRVVGAVPTVVLPQNLVATHPTMSVFFRRCAPVLWGLAVSADRSRLKMPPPASGRKHIADFKSSSLEAPGHCGHCRVGREQRGARMEKS